MLVLPDLQYVTERQESEASPLPSPNEPNGTLRVVSLLPLLIALFISFYCVYALCLRAVAWRFLGARRHAQPNSEQYRDFQDGPPWIPVDANHVGLREVPPGYVMVHIGNGEYVYVSQYEYPEHVGFPASPPPAAHADAEAGTVGPRFDPDNLASFEAPGSEREMPCAICLDPLGTEPVSAGQCLHLMHRSCLTGWLRKDTQSACPVCRVQFMDSASREDVQARFIGHGTDIDAGEENVLTEFPTSPEHAANVMRPSGVGHMEPTAGQLESNGFGIPRTAESGEQEAAAADTERNHNHIKLPATELPDSGSEEVRTSKGGGEDTVWGTESSVLGSFAESSQRVANVVAGCNSETSPGSAEPVSLKENGNDAANEEWRNSKEPEPVPIRLYPRTSDLD